MVKPLLTVRHYCQGIGDSHLLQFARTDGSPYFVLIDCGLHASVSGGPDYMDRVVADIAAATNSHLDVLVVTHEHWDHVSAFLTAAAAFGDFTVGEVWMGWTENPDEPEARRLDTFKTLAMNVSAQAATRLARSAAPLAPSLHRGLRALEGFQFSLKGERVRKARDAARDLGNELYYLDPQTEPFELPHVPGVRVYVLGPPRSEAQLRLTTRQTEMYGLGISRGIGLAQALASSPAFASGETIDAYAPFDIEQGDDLDALLAGSKAADGVGAFLEAHYSGIGGDRSQSWRRIDDDWLYAAADLALQFDSRTNNTSLVLAFEFTRSNRVVLFAADAQVGNWLSWQDLKWETEGVEVTGPDLLGRVIYLKVAHHGSENATLEEKGLELMESPDLAAFVPVNQVDAKRVGWGRMPFEDILTRLQEKTAGRVIRADDGWIDSAKPAPSALKGGAIVTLNHKKGLWVEVGIA